VPPLEAPQRTSELVRVVTAGSVDDGKSTLIGRLLYETEQVLDDQLEHVERTSRERGDGYMNLALLTDGLRAEREQGITIDVAYRYFQTPRRKFVLADSPGHEQYTRNMVTGASTADVALVLVDARSGVVEQSRRHALIAALLRIPHAVVGVNKMDLVGFDEAAFRAVVRDFEPLGLSDVQFVPISALHGDNVVERSPRTPWYDGPSLLHWLEDVPVAGEPASHELRFPVQWVVRPMSDDHHDYRGYAGQVASGVVRPGDDVTVLPSGRQTRVAAVETADGELSEAFPPLSVTLRLEDDLDVSRGDMVVHAGEVPPAVREVAATVCWMSERPLAPGDRFRLKHTTRTVPARVEAIESRLDVNTLAEQPAAPQLQLNDIGRVRLRLGAPVFADPYERNRATGSFVLVEPGSNETAGAGMIS
jgi:sulfate adenylyltransferase large subunit